MIIREKRNNAWQPVIRCLIVATAALFLVSCASVTKKTSPKPVPNPASPPRSQTTTGEMPKPYKVLGKWYQPMPEERVKGFKQSGIASWYGEKFNGRPTSSGEIYDMDMVSAAHKTLPLGTYVRVYNLENNRSLDVRINDRGPFVSGRIIDLSKEAAKRIGIYGPGTARVRISALGLGKRSKTDYGNVVSYTPINYYNGRFTIQVGAFRVEENARNLMKELDRTYKNAHITRYYSHSDGEKYYRVQVGLFSNLQKAEKSKETIRKRGFKSAFIVAE